MRCILLRGTRTSIGRLTTKKSYRKNIRGNVILFVGKRHVEHENENQDKLDGWKWKPRVEGGQAKSYPPGGR